MGSRPWTICMGFTGPTLRYRRQSSCQAGYALDMPAGSEHFMSDLAPLAEAVAVDPLVGHPEDYHVFQQFIERCKRLPAITTAVVWPLSDVALRGAVEAAQA